MITEHVHKQLSESHYLEWSLNYCFYMYFFPSDDKVSEVLLIFCIAGSSWSCWSAWCWWCARASWYHADAASKYRTQNNISHFWQHRSITGVISCALNNDETRTNTLSNLQNASVRVCLCLTVPLWWWWWEGSSGVGPRSSSPGHPLPG